MSDIERSEAPAAGDRGTVQRSKEVRLWLVAEAEEADRARKKKRDSSEILPEGPKAAKPQGLAALSLSGGGIRSATFSLGIIQALANSSRDALGKIDILSTVSGGGYIGCFLRSLFVPQEARGISPGDDRMNGRIEVRLDARAVEDQRQFARTVLKSSVHDKAIEWPAAGGGTEIRRNPLWWLREHSRYLAPNGATDYGWAAAYLTRNWLAMLYIFFIASLAVCAIVIFGEAALAQRWPHAFDWTWLEWTKAAAKPACGSGCPPPQVVTMPVSPLFALLLPALAGSLVISIAYWMTESMSVNEPTSRRQWLYLLRDLGGTTLGIIAVAAIMWWLLDPAAWLELQRGSAWGKPTIAAVMIGGAVLTSMAVIFALVCSLTVAGLGPLLTTELRRRLTGLLADSNFWFMAFAAIALVDTLGAALQYWFRYGEGKTFGGAGAALLPILAFLLKKLPEWFKTPGKSGFGAVVARFLAPAAMLAGIVLYGMLAVAADALLHAVAWEKQAWLGTPQWPMLFLVFGTVVVLALMAGTSNGFINLSSLHGLYASRLTRAYLGATNTKRLVAAEAEAKGFSIKDNDPRDYIQPTVYCRADLPAPIHFINATINETIDPHSQIVARDRKGFVLTLEPSGVRTGLNSLVPWREIGDKKCAQHISLGQWCAISGAAASSGMGRLTNLGFALALTFANVRLGYWWWAPGVPPPEGPEPLKSVRSGVLGTFIYLFNEMTARYSLQYTRKYITDGGHSEDTGAYRLIEHGVPLILLSDNGADPGYTFGDLEALVRMVRLDFGAELDLLRGDELGAFLDSLGAEDHSIFVHPEPDRDWRLQFRAKAPGEPQPPGPFVLALRTFHKDTQIHILWIKPRIISDMPADLMGYHAANPAFPQQTTGDQFFDEAQWESYRKLGQLCTERLLETCPKLFA